MSIVAFCRFDVSLILFVTFHLVSRFPTSISHPFCSSSAVATVPCLFDGTSLLSCSAHWTFQAWLSERNEQERLGPFCCFVKLRSAFKARVKIFKPTDQRKNDNWNERVWPKRLMEVLQALRRTSQQQIAASQHNHKWRYNMKAKPQSAIKTEPLSSKDMSHVSNSLNGLCEIWTEKVRCQLFCLIHSVGTWESPVPDFSNFAFRTSWILLNPEDPLKTCFQLLVHLAWTKVYQQWRHLRSPISHLEPGTAGTLSLSLSPLHKVWLTVILRHFDSFLLALRPKQ